MGLGFILSRTVFVDPQKICNYSFVRVCSGFQRQPPFVPLPNDFFLLFGIEKYFKIFLTVVDSRSSCWLLAPIFETYRWFLRTEPRHGADEKEIRDDFESNFLPLLCGPFFFLFAFLFRIAAAAALLLVVVAVVVTVAELHFFALCSSPFHFFLSHNPQKTKRKFSRTYPGGTKPKTSGTKMDSSTSFATRQQDVTALLSPSPSGGSASQHLFFPKPTAVVTVVKFFCRHSLPQKKKNLHCCGDFFPTIPRFLPAALLAVPDLLQPADFQPEQFPPTIFTFFRTHST